MNNKFLIITVFISNIAFAAVVPKINLQETVNLKNTNKLTTKISKQLFNRGLERKVIQKKLEASLIHNENITELMAQNILKNIQSLQEKDIVDFMAQAILKRKRVDLSSYATLISLVQKHSITTFDDSMLLHVEKVSNENNKLLSMKVSL